MLLILCIFDSFKLISYCLLNRSRRQWGIRIQKFEQSKWLDLKGKQNMIKLDQMNLC